MLAVITKLYEKERENRDGKKVVTALFEWDGARRAVPVLVEKKHSVGDTIEVHLREVYSKDKGQSFKWWECAE